jgi:hypothetical protein
MMRVARKRPPMSPQPRRRHSWNRSQADSGFRPIRQVGLAYSVGFPLMVVGMFMIPIAYTAESTFLWAVAVGLFVAGLFVAASGRIT